jgi:hypothetical protein
MSTASRLRHLLEIPPCVRVEVGTSEVLGIVGPNVSADRARPSFHRWSPQNLLIKAD